MSGDSDRPIVLFRNFLENKAENDVHIAFPLPSSIQIGDSAVYNNSEIGFTGALILSAAAGTSVSEVATNVINAAGSAIPKDFRSMFGILSQTIGGSESKSAASVASRTTLNKNIVTEFTGVSTRSFSFSFKLVANSKEDTEVIHNIVKAFRRGIYPVGDALKLTYPPTWYINFKQGNKDIEYVPKIFESYLTSMNTNLNSSSNMFHPDGSPKEIDLQLNFMESRSLVRADIESLEKKPFAKGDFLRSFGALDTPEIPFIGPPKPDK